VVPLAASFCFFLRVDANSVRWGTLCAPRALPGPPEGQVATSPTQQPKLPYWQLSRAHTQFWILVLTRYSFSRIKNGIVPSPPPRAARAGGLRRTGPRQLTPTNYSLKANAYCMRYAWRNLRNLRALIIILAQPALSATGLSPPPCTDATGG
jgi:hypothetical protein